MRQMGPRYRTSRMSAALPIMATPKCATAIAKPTTYRPVPRQNAIRMHKEVDSLTRSMSRKGFSTGEEVFVDRQETRRLQRAGCEGAADTLFPRVILSSLENRSTEALRQQGRNDGADRRASAWRQLVRSYSHSSPRHALKEFSFLGQGVSGRRG